jgi:hypothetical protein
MEEKETKYPIKNNLHLPDFGLKTLIHCFLYRIKRRADVYQSETDNSCKNLTMAYNFCRIHGSLRCSPAMKAGVAPTLWDIVDVVRIIEEWEARR